MPSRDLPDHVLAGSFDPHDPAFIDDPYPTYELLRERCPVLHSDRYMDGFWLLTRHEDVKAAVSDWRTYTSSVPGVTGIPMMIQRDYAILPIEVDPPEHTRYRTLVSPLFRRDRVEELRPAVRRIADSLLKPLLERGRGDLASEYAKRLSVSTLGVFLGLPAADSADWTSWVEKFHGSTDDRQGAVYATEAFNQYLLELIAERRDEPGDDFISRLVEAELDDRRLSDDEARQFALVVMAAGFETTAGGIGLTLLHLATHERDLAQLRAERELIPTAVEEFLRLASPIQMFGRNATCDVELHGRQIGDGDVVAVAFASANRDPDAFDRADDCILDRSPNRHLAFGFGPHVCLGAHVARLELSVTLEVFTERVATLELVPGDPPVRKRRGDQIALASLPALLA